MLKGVLVVLATLALARAADLSGEADASVTAMDAQLAALREEVSSLQSQNDNLLADAKALGMEQLSAPAPLAQATTAELDTAASEASAAELDAEIAAAVVDTSATEADAEAAAESGAEDQAVDAQVDIYADGNAAAEVSDDTANAVDEAPAPAALAEVDAQHKVDALIGEEKAVDAEMAGLEGELQSLMDESDSVLLANAESDAEEDVAAEEAAAAGEDEAEEEESSDEAEETETSDAEEEAEVAEQLDDAFAFRQVVESASEGEEALLSAEAALPSEDRDETPSVDAAVAEEAESEDLADAVADAEAELAAEATEEEETADDEDEAEAEAEEEVDEDAAAEAEVDVDTELEMDEQAVEDADAALDETTALVETQTAESAQLASLMEQEQTFRAALEAEHAEKADLDRQITQEKYISAEAHRELAARIAEINAIITRKSGELGALEVQRKAKAAALKAVDQQLLARTAKAQQITADNSKASKLQSRVVASIQKSMAEAKAARQQKSDAVAAANAATAESEKARLELAALRAQMEVAQKTLFRSRLSHSFGLVESPKRKQKKPEPKYGMYLRDGQESGAEDSGQAFWRRVVARRTGKGFYEPYYERVYKNKPKKQGKKKCTVGKNGKKTCKKVKKVKKQYIRPEWAPEPPKKCKKGFLGKLCRLKKKLAKLTVDMSVVPEFAAERVQPVEYVDRVPKRDAHVAALLRRIALAEKALAMYGTGAFSGPRFQQLHGEDEAEEEAEAEDESEEEAEEESEDESEEESEDEAEAEDESEEEESEEEADESEEEDSEEAEEEEAVEAEEEEAPAAAAPAAAAPAPAAASEDVMRFAQALVQANADMQARLQAAAEHDAAATQAAETEAEAHTEAESQAEAEAQTETEAAAATEQTAEAAAETETAAVAETEAHTEAAAAGAVEAEAVQSLAALKRWGPNAVEADELTALDKLIAKMQHFRHAVSTKAMKKACVKGDAACLKTAQEAATNKLKKKMAKFTLKPTIIDVRRKLLLKRLALLRKIKKAQKKANPEFLTPQYTPGAAADFVKPEYAGEKNKKIHLGLPTGWLIPKRLTQRK